MLYHTAYARDGVAAQLQNVTTARPHRRSLSTAVVLSPLCTAGLAMGPRACLQDSCH
jgi:hypothetical protein